MLHLIPLIHFIVVTLLIVIDINTLKNRILEIFTYILHATCLH